MKIIFQDWETNTGCLTSRILLLQFRFLQYMSNYRLCFIIYYFHWFIYKIFSQYGLNIELSPKTKVGSELKLPHPYNIIINSKTIIGEGCTIRNNTTIGDKGSKSSTTLGLCPTINNNVDIGCSTVIIGEVTIGSNVIIGAGSVVLKDVPENSICVGNPGYNKKITAFPNKK
jgi:putative colanic acid biosynthesis acetyltransferase WcaB